MQWDKNVLNLVLTPMSQKHFNICYQMNKSPLNFANRDFVDKQVKISDNGVFYCYYSFIPQGADFHNVPDKVERA